MRRLSEATLPDLPPEFVQFAYDRDAVTTGVVHLGLGAFHRAHQAPIFDAALQSGDRRWGVVGVSMRSSDVRDALVPQDCLYTVASRDGDQHSVRVIGAIQRVLVLPENPKAVVAAMADPDIHIVTLTVTEKGYRLDPATGKLAMDDPDVHGDMVSLATPRTVQGLIVAALAKRRALGLRPFTVVSCDNLPGNGKLLRDSVLKMAMAHDPELSAWIEQKGAFPRTMVDRIVPATTADDIAALAMSLGTEDRATVKTEPFSQWVIENHFAGPTPDFARLGVELVGDLASWEHAKLRLLNAAHSAMAYLGGLAGLTFVHEFVAIPAGWRFVERLWDEAMATLEVSVDFDPVAYRHALMRRFENAALRHELRQIGADGSQKIPQRWLATISARRRRGEAVEMLSMALAAWIRWQGGLDDAGRAFIVDDPLAALTRPALAASKGVKGNVDAVMSISSVIPLEIANDPQLRDSVVCALNRLVRDGAIAAIADRDRVVD